jgi:hypothetical protein
VLRIEGGALAEITAFATDVFPRFGLSQTLSSTGRSSP